MSTSFPTVWDTLISTYLPTVLPGVQVVDGVIGEYLAFDYVQVVDLDGEDEPATVGRPTRYNERYLINCLVRAYAGDSDMPTRRARAAAMYEAIRTGLVSDPSMGGAVNGRAYTTRYRYSVGPTEKGGSAAHIEFAISVTHQALT